MESSQLIAGSQQKYTIQQVQQAFGAKSEGAYGVQNTVRNAATGLVAAASLAAIIVGNLFVGGLFKRIVVSIVPLGPAFMMYSIRNRFADSDEKTKEKLQQHAAELNSEEKLTLSAWADKLQLSTVTTQIMRFYL